MATAYGLYVDVRGYELEVLLNDIPLVATAVDRRKVSSVHVTTWTVDGTNDLRMVIARSLLHPERSGHEPLEEVPVEDPDSPWRARAEVVEGELGQLPNEDGTKRLATMAWIPPTDRDWTLPFTAIESFQLNGRPRWAWQDGRVFDASATDTRKSLLDYVRALHADLVAKRIDAVLDRMQARLAEVVHLGATPAEVRASLHESFYEMASLPDYEVDPYDDDEVVFRICGGGRVISVLRKDGGPFLRSGPRSSEEWSLPLWLYELEKGIEIIIGN